MCTVPLVETVGPEREGKDIDVDLEKDPTPEETKEGIKDLLPFVIVREKEAGEIHP